MSVCPLSFFTAFHRGLTPSTWLRSSSRRFRGSFWLTNAKCWPTAETLSLCLAMYAKDTQFRGVFTIQCRAMAIRPWCSSLWLAFPLGVLEVYLVCPPVSFLSLPRGHHLFFCCDIKTGTIGLRVVPSIGVGLPGHTSLCLPSPSLQPSTPPCSFPLLHVALWFVFRRGVSLDAVN